MNSNYNHPVDTSPDQGIQRTGTGSKQPPGGWTKHAPPGGITIGGKYFKGGVFIPNEDFENATSSELANLQKIEDIKAQYGPKAAKEYSQSLQQGRPAEKPMEETKSSGKPTEIIFIVNDGTLLHSPSYYGFFVIRNNPFPEPTITSKDLNILSSCECKRFDLINDSEGIVYSITAEGHWPKEISEENLFQKITKQFPTKQIHLDQYLILNNASPEVSSLFKSAALKMRMSCEFANNFYSELGVPVIPFNSEPMDRREIKTGPEGDSFNLSDTGMKMLLRNLVIDILLGNKDFLGNNGNHIIVINGMPTRTNTHMNLDTPIDDFIGLINTNDMKDQLQRFDGKITPEFIDNLINKLSYPDSNIKDKLLARWEDIRRTYS